MADIQFESPVTSPNVAAKQGVILVADESSTTKANIRAAEGTPAAAALGLTFGHAEHRGSTFIARIRPDEWMIFGAAEAIRATLSALDLAGHASYVDISHSRLMFRVTGELAPKAMEKVCNLDFSEQMTPNGACAGASVAKVSCDVMRDDLDGVRSYRILCDRSFGQYLMDALIDAKAEFG